MAWFELGKLFRAQTPQERLLRAGVRADLALAVGRMAGDRRSDPTVVTLGGQLDDAETVLRVMEGRFERRAGLLALTDRRIVFVGHGYLGGPLADRPLGQIERVTGAGSARAGTSVTFTGADFTLVVDRGIALSAVQFAEAVEEFRTVGAKRSPDPLDLLVELRALRDRGDLAEDAYQEQRKRLVDEL